jgi:hypothetical protein
MRVPILPAFSISGLSSKAVPYIPVLRLTSIGPTDHLAEPEEDGQVANTVSADALKIAKYPRDTPEEEEAFCSDISMKEFLALMATSRSVLLSSGQCCAIRKVKIE